VHPESRQRLFQMTQTVYYNLKPGQQFVGEHRANPLQRRNPVVELSTLAKTSK
jgi:hypothetical protein